MGLIRTIGIAAASLLVGGLLGAVYGPKPVCPECAEVVEVETHDASETALIQEAHDEQLEKLKDEIRSLEIELENKRPITIIEEVPVECKEVVVRQAESTATDCLPNHNVHIINRAINAANNGEKL